LEHLLLSELRSVLQDEASDPALESVRPVDVRLSPDGAHARVGYVVAHRGDEDAAKDALIRATGFLRARLTTALDLKRTPTLGFVFIGRDA
jgi:ribosome-binding factor A